MARDFDGSTGYLDRGAAVLTAVAPHTFSAWIYPDALGFVDVVGVYGSGGGADSGYRLNIDNGPVRYTSNFGSFRFADSTTDVTTGSWQHICGRAESNTARSAFLNGGSKGTGGGTATDGTESNTRIGARGDDAGFFSGRIEWVTIWDTDLSDNEVAILAQGCNPIRIRPGNQVSLVPIWGDSPERDLLDGSSWTVNGTASYASGAPVEPPFSTTRYFFTSAAPTVTLDSWYPGVEQPSPPPIEVIPYR